MNRSNHMLSMNLSYNCSDCVQAILILLFCSLDEMDLIWGVQHLVFVICLHIMISIYIIHCLQVIFFFFFFCSSKNSCVVMIMGLALL